MKKSFSLSVLVLMLVLNLSACGGGGGGGGSASYSIGGTMNGLTGTVVLQNNGADDLTIIADGAFTFATKVADNGAYSVTVLTQPAGQTCTASSNTGTISGANVTNVSVVCSVNTYSVGGAVSGLTGSGLVLSNNGGDDLAVPANSASFTFAAKVADGAGYLVTVKTQPTGPSQTCTASSNSGAISGANVTNVSVVCSVNSYSVGGTVSGLAGTMVLRNNGSDNLTITTNSAFTFLTALADNSSYSVTILSDPVLQNCSVSNGSGTISGSNVTNVSVTCANKSWTHPASLTDHISPEGGSIGTPQAAMDDNGNAVIVWDQDDGSGIFKSEYRNGVWTHPSSLTDDHISPDGSGAYSPQVAMDNNGNAVIVWTQYDGTNNQIFKSEYRNSAWTHPSSLTNDHISPDGQNADGPQVAMDNNGNAVIVWYQYDGTNYQIFKSEYRNGAWTHPLSLTHDHISPDGRDAYSPQVAMDNNGNTVIVWHQYDGTYYQIFKSEYRNSAWTHPLSLTDDHISPDGQYAYSPQVAMDNNGNAVIVWYQNDGTSTQIFKSEFR